MGIHGQVRAVGLAEYTDEWLTGVPKRSCWSWPLLIYVYSSFCSNECVWLSEWMKTLHRLTKDCLTILIHPPINTSIQSLGSAASPYNKHLTLACRQTAKESKLVILKLFQIAFVSRCSVANLSSIALHLATLLPPLPGHWSITPLKARPVNTSATFQKMHIKFWRCTSRRFISQNDKKLHFFKTIYL